MDEVKQVNLEDEAAKEPVTVSLKRKIELKKRREKWWITKLDWEWGRSPKKGLEKAGRNDSPDTVCTSVLNF